MSCNDLQNIKTLNEKDKIVLEFVKLNSNLTSLEIFLNFSETISYATIKRILQKLISQNLILSDKKGKSTTYRLSEIYEINYEINLEEYFKKEIDERNINSNFNFELFEKKLLLNDVFTKNEFEFLEKLQQNYLTNISSLSKNEYDKELERLAIDLSWKSSQIEGNTYSLLETERLLKDKETASGKTKDEAVMLLNHKETLDFIIENPDFINPISISKIENIHSFLTKELEIDRNIRRRRVGISGTNYKPLDNEYEIREALEKMCLLINETSNVFQKALLVLVLISYIQPFADGNKRTARIVSNAILIQNNFCPISFRTVDSIDYKKAMLIFYELNNISAFKKIFINQFEFAVKTYF